MNRHLYLRAYLAGIAIPTAFLLFILAGLLLARSVVVPFPAPVERAVVFPMAVVPNLWGFWNMLHVRLHRCSTGLFGALLPLLLVPAGYLLGQVLGIPYPVPWLPWAGLPLAIAVYYLVWKHAVGFLNDLLGVA
jgi:hypothetical protein